MNTITATISQPSAVLKVMGILPMLAATLLVAPYEDFRLTLGYSSSLFHYFCVSFLGLDTIIIDGFVFGGNE